MKFSSIGKTTLFLSGACAVLACTAGAAQATITFTTPVALAGATPGLETTIQYYVPTFGTSSSGSYVGAGGYDSPAGGLPIDLPTPATLSNMESFLRNGSFTVPAGQSNNGVATTFTTASESSSVTTVGNVVQNNNFNYPGYTLNNIPVNAPVAYNVDQQGYIDIATPGTYTFNMAQADDAAEVYIGGNGTAGSGTSIVDNAYNNGNLFTPTTAVDFTTAGLYHFELFYYQGWGGQGITYSVTPPNGAAAPTYFVGAVPEPATLGLMGIGAAGLLLIGRKRKMV